MTATHASLSQDWYGTISGYSVIKISGEERIKYLQGQVTCNVESLEDNTACIGAHCDFKGKMWAVFICIKTPDSLLLIAPNGAAEASFNELKKYGVFSKIDIELQTPVLTAEFSNENKTTWQVSNQEDSLHIQISPNLAVTILTGSAPENNVTELFNASLIRLGIGLVDADTVNEYVPQMINLQAIDNAIDFTKGCYMGQEVVARTKYLGKNKRAGWILYSEQSISLNQGSVVEYAIGENWRRGGAILNHGISDGGTYALAVLPNDLSHDTVLRLKEAPEVTFAIQALPYSLEA